MKEYIEFINEYDIKYFFEMDIDMICGYKKVLEMRKQIEQGTRKRFGAIHRFDGKKIIAQTFKDKRRKHYKELDHHNLKEWIKFQEYAETNL